MIMPHCDAPKFDAIPPSRRSCGEVASDFSTAKRSVALRFLAALSARGRAARTTTKPHTRASVFLCVCACRGVAAATHFLVRCCSDTSATHFEPDDLIEKMCSFFLCTESPSTQPQYHIRCTGQTPVGCGSHAYSRSPSVHIPPLTCSLPCMCVCACVCWRISNDATLRRRGTWARERERTTLFACVTRTAHPKQYDEWNDRCASAAYDARDSPAPTRRVDGASGAPAACACSSV